MKKKPTYQELELRIIELENENKILKTNLGGKKEEKFDKDDKLNSKIAEEKYKGIIEAEPECVKILDSKGNLIEMNPAGLDMIEADSIEHVKGQSIISLIKQEYKSDFLKMIENVFQGKSQQLTFEITGLKGGSRWLESHSVPLFDSDKNVVELLAVTRDITEYKKAEQKLRKRNEELKEKNEEYESLNEELKESNDNIKEININLKKTKERVEESEKKFHELFEKSGDAILIIENETFIDCNQATVEMLKYSTKEEFLDVHPSKLSPETQPDGRKSVEKADEMMETAIKNGTHRFEWDHMKSNGEVFPVEVLLTAISNDPDKRVIHTVWNDITERKMAEQKQNVLYNISKFANESNHLRTFLEKVHLELSTLINTDNFYVALYHAGPDKYSFVYHVDKYDDFEDPEQMMEIKQSLTDYTRRTAKSILIDEKLDSELRKAGEIKLIGEASAIWLGAPLIDSKGNSMGVIAVQDYESETAYTNSDLELLDFVARNIGSLIEKLNFELSLKKSLEDLKIAKEKAEESDRFKSAFLANMSHEIRTPMNGIVGFSELLMERDLSDTKRNEFINIINNSCQQLLGIVNDIIDISKIETGQIDINNEKTSINDLFEKLFSTYSHVAQNAGLKINIKESLSDQQLIILTDKIKLRQILDNLISNAIKFTHKGNVGFGYNIVAKKHGRAALQQIEFYVEDTGIGISKKEQEIIFGRFNQAKLNIALNYGGTGLGLSIAKAYVEKLGGKIWLRSKEGKGSTFYFTIPYVPVSQFEKEEVSVIINEESNKQICILVVEDDKTNFKLIEEILKKLNAKLLHAKTGAEALEIFKNNTQINLVLMDIKLQDVSGLEVTKQIKLIRDNVPIIAQTAYAFETDREKALKAGCIDYISKPIISNELISKVNQYVIKSSD